MDVRGESRIGRAERQCGMKMPGFIEECTVQGHKIVSSSQAWGCMYAVSAMEIRTPSVGGASSSIRHGYVRVKDTHAALALLSAPKLGLSYVCSEGVRVSTRPARAVPVDIPPPSGYRHRM